MKTLLLIICLSLSCISFSQNLDSSDHYFKKGLEEKSNRRFLVALTDFQKSVLFRADNADAQKELGLTALEMRKYDLAKISFLKLLELHHDDPIAVENLTNIFFWTRKWNEAILYASKMQQLKIGKTANYIIGRSHYEMENYGEAYQYLLAASKDVPANPEIPYLIGRGFVDMN